MKTKKYEDIILKARHLFKGNNEIHKSLNSKYYLNKYHFLVEVAFSKKCHQ